MYPLYIKQHTCSAVISIGLIANINFYFLLECMIVQFQHCKLTYTRQEMNWRIIPTVLHIGKGYSI